MKKLLIILAVLVSISASAQVKLISDTLQGNETVNFATINATGKYVALSLDILCTEIGGTSDGTLILQARNANGADWQTLGTTRHGSFLAMSPADSVMTITDGADFKISLVPPTYRQYRVVGAGTANDTTKVDIWYTFKE